MSDLSFSISYGLPGDDRHDLVAEYRKGLSNVDASRTELNVKLATKSLDVVYDELFSDALAAYNEKQITKGHPERVIDNYLEHIRASKQEKPEYEMVVQIGNKDTNPATDENCRKLSAKIYTEFFKELKKQFPNFAVTVAVIHMDESTPHLQIRYVPYTTGSKRGLATRTSLTGAAKAMGHERIEDVNDALKKLLQEVAKKHDVERLDMNMRGVRHLSVYDYKRKMAREQEYPYNNDPDLVATVVEQKKVIDQLIESHEEAQAELGRVAQGDVDPDRAQTLNERMAALARRLKEPIGIMREIVGAIPQQWRDNIINPIAGWMRKPFPAPEPGYFPPLSAFRVYEDEVAGWVDYQFEDAFEHKLAIRVEPRAESYLAAMTAPNGEPMLASGSTAHEAVEQAHAMLKLQYEIAGTAIGRDNVLKKSATLNPFPHPKARLEQAEPPKVAQPVPAAAKARIR